MSISPERLESLESHEYLLSDSTLSTSPNSQDYKMLLARVIGNVVATQKNQRYEQSRIMLCRQITPEGEDTDTTMLALDSVDSGEGDIVLILQEGWGASTAATKKAGAAIDSAIVGVVDYIDLLPDEK
jgi:ethanolamine utilization protein EutN